MGSTKNVDLTKYFSQDHDMLKPEHSRAARGWLDWSQEELAKRAKVSLSTIRDFEKGRRVPIANNLSAIEKVLEVAGVTCQSGKGGIPTGIFMTAKGAEEEEE